MLTHPPFKFHQLGHFYLQNLLQPIYANLLGMDTFCLPSAETDICEDYVELFYDLSLVGSVSIIIILMKTPARVNYFDLYELFCILAIRKEIGRVCRSY